MRKKTGKTTAKKVDLLKLIKNRRTIRKYQDRPISKRILNKIIEAGVWGPSVHGIQPWQFLVINNASFIKEVAKILLRRSMEKEIAGRILLDSTANTINNAPLLIAVYNNKEVVK
ncbi:MAG: nitroreductase family protein, partial [Candidatus Omnitrophica bacterium]|nr:nitroreductase family protein [Candidatus Omnitrophota bacterium]